VQARRASKLVCRKTEAGRQLGAPSEPQPTLPVVVCGLRL